MNVLILGGNSDIGQELLSRFENEGHDVFTWTRNSCNFTYQEKWDLIICCIGVLTPIGNFFETDWHEWKESVESNVMLGLRLLRSVWSQRNRNASVCFFSGAGTSNSAKTYSAYSASKMMLYKMTELLDDEEPDVKFFILGPGMVRTKIQQQTLDAGSKAANFERVSKFMTEGDELHKTGTSHDKIYDCLKWCISLPKEMVGGRNFYVPDYPYSEEVIEKLKTNPRFYKLRRHE